MALSVLVYVLQYYADVNVFISFSLIDQCFNDIMRTLKRYINKMAHEIARRTKAL